MPLMIKPTPLQCELLAALCAGPVRRDQGFWLSEDGRQFHITTVRALLRRGWANATHVNGRAFCVSITASGRATYKRTAVFRAASTESKAA